ncbi:MAG: hypothetical protein GEU92_17905 [Alphaproteobacteria bacterium]|nr:hypothetical protein [Alphaproteobacteria bacterium]
MRALSRALVVLALVAAAHAASAEDLSDPAASLEESEPSCPPEIVPPWPEEGDEPDYLGWADGAVPLAAIASCTSWDGWQPTLVVSLAGVFRLDGGVNALLARLGGISGFAGVKYWSFYNRDWTTMIKSASALKSADAKARREDFTAAELGDGAPRYFVQHDNRSTGGTVYRLRVTERSDDLLRVEVENVTKVSFLIVTAYQPRDLRSVHVFRRAGPRLWRYFGLAGMRASGVSVLGRASATNRTVAIYRHLIGVPTDQEPPAALE